MSETIRSVVVKVRTEIEQPVIPAPDASQFEATAAEIADEAKQAFENSVIDGFQDSLDEATAALSEARDALESIANTADDAADALEDVADAADSAADAAEDFEKIAEQQEQVTDQNIKAAESFKKIGDGAFAAARGVALLVTSNDEDMQKMLETVAAIQGTFDLFKGSTDIIIGTVEAMRAMRASKVAAAAASGIAAKATVAETAATTAQASASLGATGAATAQSAANVGIATTATTASVAMTALNVAMGPIGIAIAAIGAVVVGIIALFSDWGESQEELEERTLETTKALNEQRIAMNELERTRRSIANQAASSRQENINERFGSESAEAEYEREQRLKNIAAQYKTINEELKREGEQIRARQAAEIAQGVDEWEAMGRAIEASAELRVRKQKEANELAREEQRIKREQLQREQDLDDLEKRKIEKRQTARDLALKELETAEKILEREQDRVRSLEERIGLLSEEEASELKRIQEKVERGETLNRDEVAFAESKLGAENVAGATRASRDQFIAERGGRAAFGGLLGADEFEDSAEAQQARRDKERLEKSIESQESIDQSTQELKDRQVELQNRTLATMNSFVDQIEVMDKELARLEARWEESRDSG